ncbi:SCO family protein [Roseospira marina]|uniref:SCO family protein n=1 Tax=Roseospira marina TaxID=140057 RepID=A0A5M6IA23_9PROT|nr:SCO family protein [Roseospira marina]KAA5605100.1 SCO family protein [Roseospira marina]MBB4314849.1 protein SCO1/2 [Roseospira marina]MBB5087849.1 protein SCO1/2 [Roseospira marina]
MRRGKVASIAGGVAVVLVVVAVGLLPRLGLLDGLLDGLLNGGDSVSDAASSTTGTTAGEADIGGPFTLVNGAGETVTEASWPGQYLLIYFGYTYCPDVCPTSLQTMTLALDQLDPALVEKVQPVFISIDPERDRPADVAEYVGFFHPKMVGLTGTPEQVAAAAQAYRVYYAKVEQPESEAPYLMDHSAITYLMAPDGRLAAFFRHGEDPAVMAEQMRAILNGSES